MKIIQNELGFIKDELLRGLVEQIPKNGLKDFILNGSKFIRSKLGLLYFKAQNVQITDDIYSVFCAGELIHSASLLHDDVLDEAETRRGHITIAKEYSSHVSILAGDYLLSIAMEKLLKLNNIKVFKIFKNCTKSMTEAELKQYFLRGSLPIENEYLDICKGKTASLFSAILESVACVSGMDSEKAKKMGELYGLSFQVKNDLQEVSAEQDKKNGILTAKDILGIEKTTNLLDNYKIEMKNLIKDFPENVYKEGVEDLINTL